MSSLEQWGIILAVFVAYIFFSESNYSGELKKQTKLDKIIENIGVVFKKIGSIILGVIGFFIVLAWIVVWLGFFGVIPQGPKTDDRYFDEMHDPFNW